MLRIILVARQGVPECSIAAHDKDKKGAHGHPEQGHEPQQRKNAGIDTVGLRGVALAETRGTGEGVWRPEPTPNYQGTECKGMLGCSHFRES